MREPKYLIIIATIAPIKEAILAHKYWLIGKRT